MFEEKKVDLSKFTKYGKIAALGGIAFVTLMSSYTYVESGESVRIQSPAGGHSWYTTAGIKLKVPFLSKVHRYNQNYTVSITDNEDVMKSATISSSPQMVTFSDTYNGHIEATYRFEIAKDAESLEKMHQAVKSSDNLAGNTLMPFSRDLLNYTSNQVRAEDFMQGGQNDFQTRLIDQAMNGKYVTLREKVLVNTEVADRDKDRQAGKANTGQQFVYKVVRKRNSSGEFERQVVSIADYGITIVPAGISLTEFVPEQKLQEFMKDKKDRVRARAKIVEDQENERQMAITAQLKGERERIQKQNVLLQQKDAAIIAGEKEVAQAKLQAEKEVVEREKVANLAKIDKARELQIAKDNEGIQKANYAAAQFEAKAIKETGFAQAAVDAAKLKAKKDNQEIYLAELNRDIQIKTAEVLPKVKIELPNIVMGGSNGGQGDVSNLLSTKLVQDVINNTNKGK